MQLFFQKLIELCAKSLEIKQKKEEDSEASEDNAEEKGAIYDEEQEHWLYEHIADDDSSDLSEFDEERELDHYCDSPLDKIDEVMLVGTKLQEL